MTALASDLAAALDPVLFARGAGIDFDPWQREVVRSNHQRLLLNCSRQSGKSTVTACLAMHQALFVPGSLILLLSPGQRQSGELYRKCAALYGATGGIVPATSETKLTLELTNGSRIVALPGRESTIRGYSGVALLVIDEASRVEDALYTSVRPMLATTGGRLAALSTPNGKRGWWSDAWHSGQDWHRWEIPASECPRIPAAFLAEEQATIGSWWFRQEYLCQFLDSESAAFATDDIRSALSDDLETWSL